MIPDGEKLVSDYLRTELGERVVGKSPSSTTAAWVRCTQLDASAVGGHRSDHLIEFYFQFDAYAGASGGQPEASSLARRLREALVAMPQEGVDGATVTGVDIRGMARIPDDDIDEPARERFTVNAAVWIHA